MREPSTQDIRCAAVWNHSVAPPSPIIRWLRHWAAGGACDFRRNAACDRRREMIYVLVKAAVKDALAAKVEGVREANSGVETLVATYRFARRAKRDDRL